ncbi:hypothetical protein ACFSUD_09435 [Sulfitobacter aestuarii]|uniref:Lipoprotein n=1 Tax=Sulfitobacter aestuarii TaxID=2161676 RepID=A0ABW5U1T5_9RHOB
MRKTMVMSCLVLGLAGCAGSTGQFSGAAPVADVSFDADLPFGEVARVCDARGRDLGVKVEQAAVRGFALWDSRPGAAGARRYYITGFRDGCPRQLTAATVILSTPSDYEQFRFGPAAANLPYAKTDAAYDAVKRQVCGTGRRKPCGGRINRLDRSMFSVSSYRSLDDNARWFEALVHDGAVLASAVKSIR